MILGHFLIDVNEANAFIIGCEETREALLVDVAMFDPRIPEFLQHHNLALRHVFITHDHYDHTGGLARLVAEYPVTVYAGQKTVGGCAATRMHGGDTIKIGNITGRVVTTEGHTSESLSLVVPGMVFTGDALFAGSIGGTFSAEDAARERETVRANILSLPDDYQIHPGHGPSSTVRIEKTYNPFFV